MTIVIVGHEVPPVVAEAGYRLNQRFRGFKLRLCDSVASASVTLCQGTLLALVHEGEVEALSDVATGWGTVGEFVIVRKFGEIWSGRRGRRLCDFARRVGVTLLPRPPMPPNVPWYEDPQW